MVDLVVLFSLMSICVTVHQQEGHDGPVSLHWLICEIPSYQTLQYLGIGLTLSQTLDFRLPKLRVYRRQFQI